MNDILKSKSIEEIKLCMRYNVYKGGNLGSQYKNEEKEFIKKHKELIQIQKILLWGKHRPFLENYTKISEIMTRSFYKALKNEISVDEALSSATRKINEEKTYSK